MEQGGVYVKERFGQKVHVVLEEVKTRKVTIREVGRKDLKRISIEEFKKFYVPVPNSQVAKTDT